MADQEKKNDDETTSMIYMGAIVLLAASLVPVGVSQYGSVQGHRIQPDEAVRMAKSALKEARKEQW